MAQAPLACPQLGMWGSTAPPGVEELGLPVLTLPRISPRDRFHTMSIMIAVDILGCTGSTEERAALLHKTIRWPLS